MVGHTNAAPPLLALIHTALNPPLILLFIPKIDSQDAALPSGEDYSEKFPSELSNVLNPSLLINTQMIRFRTQKLLLKLLLKLKSAQRDTRANIRKLHDVVHS